MSFPYSALYSLLTKLEYIAKDYFLQIHTQLKLKWYTDCKISGSHSGTAEDNVLWDIALC
jgi:hypothetical protein